jgi:DNA-directed RNA polymerase subunit beta'
MCRAMSFFRRLISMVKKGDLKKILEKVINVHGATRPLRFWMPSRQWDIKYSTRAAMTVSISDMTVPARKAGAD